MIEDRLRGLKLRVPLAGLRLKLIPTDGELGDCRDFGRALAQAVVGTAGTPAGDKPARRPVIDFADLG
jgi:hypothetical protein